MNAKLFDVAQAVERLVATPPYALRTCLPLGSAPDTMRASRARIAWITQLGEKNNKDECLAEAGKQIASLFGRMEHLERRVDGDCVLFLLDIGRVLNAVARILDNRKKYADWERETFSEQHQRYFQQARQLARAEQFVRRNHDLGKNRLLDLIRVAKAKGCTCAELLAFHPLNGSSRQRAAQADVIITHHRLGSVPGAQIGHAEAFVKSAGRALNVREAEEIEELLNDLSEPDRPAVLENLELILEALKAKAPSEKSCLRRALKEVMRCLPEADGSDPTLACLAAEIVIALSQKFPAIVPGLFSSSQTQPEPHSAAHTEP